MATLREVNKALKTECAGVRLAQGNGYCYIYSKVDEIEEQICSLYTSSIPVCKVSQQPVEVWVSDVKRVLADSDRFEGERMPVKL